MFVIRAKCDKSFDRNVKRNFTKPIYAYLNWNVVDGKTGLDHYSSYDGKYHYFSSGNDVAANALSFTLDNNMVAQFTTEAKAAQFLEDVKYIYDVWFKIEKQLEDLDLDRGHFKIVNLDD